MTPSHRIPAHRFAGAVAGVLIALAGIAAPPAIAAQPRSRHTARPSAAVDAASVTGDVQHATGLTASQLSTRAACGSTAPARIHCYARVLTAKRTGRAAAPLHVPHVTAASAADAAPAAYTAAFLQSAYDTTWLSANRGAGDTVAIVDAYGDAGAYSDMEQFRSANGLPQIPTCGGAQTTSCFEVVNQDGQTTNLPTTQNDETQGWNLEESLDIDAVSSICPLCKLLVVEANSDDYYGSLDLEAGVLTAGALGANQISLSWGQDVPADASAYESPFSSITGAAILAAAGDSSYPGPDVGYPAALPSVTAVGGTSLTADAGTARGYAESAWSITTCAGGSICGTESGCDTSQALPSYQSGVTTGCVGRAYNDISADADPDTGLAIYDSQPGNEGCGTTNNWCIVGGTSLATPLAAAFEGVTALPGALTPAWAYGDASLLNDITSGSDGSCAAAQSVICNAGIGWDGPTGNGSISGEVVSGGPGLGGSAASFTNATDATLSGGVYANGQATSYQWQYWPSQESVSSASSSAPASISGATLQTVSSAICALSPSTTYDYELVASNGSGAETGAQGSFSTAATESVPTSTSAPSIGGTTVAGQSLTATNAVWNDASCNSAPSYAWQESSTSGGPWTTVGTAQSYPLQSANVGQYLRLAVTESNSAGDATATSSVVGPVIAAAVNTSTTPTTTTASKPAGAGASSTSVRFYRCALACELINTHGAKTYTPKPADYGRYLKVVTTVSRLTGGVQTSTTSTRWVGPVRSATAGNVSIGTGARAASAMVIRGSSGRALAQLRVARHARRLTLVVHPAKKTRVRVWAYVVSGSKIVSATAPRSLSQPLTFSFVLRRGQTIKLVAVRT